MATHSSILAWEIPRTEKRGELQSMGLQKSWTRLSTAQLTVLSTSNLHSEKAPLHGACEAIATI